MQMVKVEVKPIRDGEYPSVRYIVEVQRGAVWARQKVVDVTAGKMDTTREFLLADDERVVIESSKQDVAVWDKDQMASVPASSRPDLALNTAVASPSVPVVVTETRVSQMPALEPIKPGLQGNDAQLTRDQVKPLLKPGEKAEVKPQNLSTGSVVSPVNPSPPKPGFSKPSSDDKASPSGQGALDSKNIKA